MVSHLSYKDCTFPHADNTSLRFFSLIKLNFMWIYITDKMLCFLKSKAIKFTDVILLHTL